MRNAECRNRPAKTCLLRALCAGVLGAVLSAAVAAPADDHLLGEKAFRDGDIATARSMFKQAADAGHAPSQALVAYLLNQGDENPDAIKYYRMAVKQNNPDGMFGLAGMLISGEAKFQAAPTKDELDEAKRLIRDAAELGHRQAAIAWANNLADEKSILPISPSEREGKEVVRWLTKAAEYNDLPALTRIEAAYRNGDFGLNKDNVEADRWKKKIAEYTGNIEDPNQPRKRRRR